MWLLQLIKNLNSSADLLVKNLSDNDFKQRLQEFNGDFLKLE